MNTITTASTKPKIVKIRFFTADKLALISESNKKKFDKYYQSCTIRCKDVKETTYKTYKNFFYHFMAFLAINYNNIDLYSTEFYEEAVDIMETYISFCQETLKNNKKVINTKLSTVSSFYIWSMKRGLVATHPFNNKLERMKGASNEHIINSYFLTPEQVQQITRELNLNEDYDIQDQIIFSLMFDSANRIGAIDRLTLSSLDLDNMVFNNIREKRGDQVQVIFMSNTRELMEEWFEMRKNMDNLTVDALFICKHGNEYNQMSKSTIQNRINKMGKIIGLDDFHAHCIRKTRLSSIYDDTGDLTLVAELANHKSTETTRLAYLRPKSKIELRNKLIQLENKTINQEINNK